MNKDESNEIVRYASFKEAYEDLKNRRDLDRHSLFYTALLDALAAAAEKEARGVKVDAGTVFPDAISRVKVYAHNLEKEMSS